jgi:hypothetical protein
MLDRTGAIASAAIEVVPFPHIIVPNVLPFDVVRSILDHWPDESNMDPEPGGLGRFMFPLIADQSVRSRLGVWRRYMRLGAGEANFWRRVAAGPGADVVRDALAHFSSYNDTRFPGARYWAELSLFESGPTFSQHPPHTHFNHNPDWVMTFLLFLDDGGREDRGEVFSAPVHGSDWADVMASKPEALRPMKRIPFKPNTLLAWLDGPMSFHGTDELALDPVNRRRMLRCHAGVDDTGVRQWIGVGSAEYLEATTAYRSGDQAHLRRILEQRSEAVAAIPRFSFS